MNHDSNDPVEINHDIEKVEVSMLRSITHFKMPYLQNKKKNEYKKLA